MPDAAPMQTAADVSADGKWVLYMERSDRGNFDIYALPLDGAAPLPIATTTFNESSPSFSPDARFIAFTSDETGRSEVYVAPLGSPRAKRLRVDEWGLPATLGQSSPRTRLPDAGQSR